MAYSKIILNGETLMDVTSDTVAAGSLLSGKTATKNDGTKVTGNIASKTASDLTASGATVTAAAGYYPSAVSKAVTTTTHPNPTAAIASSTGVVTATHTQTTGYVTSGTTTGTLSLTTQAGKTVTPTESAQTAVASYRWTTGPISVAAISSTYVGTGVTTRSAADMTVAGQSVTAPAGYYSQAFTKAVTTTTHPNPAAAITSSTGVITATHTQETGYVTGGTTTGTTNLTTQGATTYNTSTADQTIASYRWLTGTQTIKSVTTTNLTAANIANGVVVKIGDTNNASRIAQVTGTYAPAVSSVTVTPTETTQTFNATGVYGYKPVTVNGISSTYVGTGVARKSSADVAFASATATFTAPIGYYSAAATKTLTTQAAQTIYPSTADQTVASYRWLTGTQTIKSVTTTNLTAANIAEGVVIKIGDANNASRITQVTGTYEGGADLPVFTITYRDSDWSVLSITCNMSYNECVSKYSNGEGGAIVNCESASHESDYSYCATCQYGESDNPDAPIGHRLRMQYNIPFGDGILGASIIYYENDDVEYVEPYYTRSTLNVTANGTYSSYFSLYDVVNVNVQGITADQIAQRTISGSISGSATSIYSYAFYNYTSLTAASFPNATSIGNSAFYSCYNLTTISFPSVISIGSYAFQGCTRLTTPSFPNVTRIGDSAFYNCTRLTIPSFPNAISIGASAFYSCTSLTTANFPNVTSIYSNAFARCSALTSISFPAVTWIGGGAFSSCTKLTAAIFPNATSINTYVFYSCYSLTIASFPVVTHISNYAFRECYNLISLYLNSVSAIPTLGTSVFHTTPISTYSTSAGRYGSIFVPSSLYASFTTATGWAAYSARMVSV